MESREDERVLWPKWPSIPAVAVWHGCVSSVSINIMDYVDTSLWGTGSVLGFGKVKIGYD